MASTFIKATKVVFAAIGLLEREITLPQLVWRDAGGSFQGVFGDTITLRVPSYANARTRTLRANTGITTDDLNETKVDITLDTDVYRAIAITDEQLTLDIADFGLQVLTPVIHAVGRGVEDALVTEMENAAYAHTVTLDPTDPWIGVVEARRLLNQARVPAGERFLAVGSEVEAKLLESNRLSLYLNAGDSNALRDATIGTIAGFTAVSHPALDPNTAIAAHRTAFVMSMQAPVVPQGVPYGASESYAGMSMRVLRDYDFANVRDRLLADVFIGTNIVRDHGTLDSSTGNATFTPATDPDTANGTDLHFVRAVKLSL